MKGLTILILALFTSFSRTEDNSISVGVSLPTEDEDIWKWYKAAFQSYNNTSSIDGKHTLKIFIEVAKSKKVSEQQAQTERLFSQKINVLIIGPHDTRAAANLVEYAHQLRIKVISFVRLISNAKVDAFISPDLEELGKEQAQFLLDKDPKGHYLILKGPVTDLNSKIFYEAAMTLLKPRAEKGEITISDERVIEDWLQQNAKNETAAALKNDRDISSILAPNDSTAKGAMDAVNEINKTVYLTGHDCDHNATAIFHNKTQHFITANLKPEKTVEQALKMAILLKDNKPILFKKKIPNGRYEIPTFLTEYETVSESGKCPNATMATQKMNSEL